LGRDELSTKHHLHRALTAAAIDCIGEGMFIPLTFLFFVLTTRMSTADIGTAVSIGTFLAWPTGLIAMSFVDRLGAKWMIIGNNLITAIGYATYLLVRNVPELVCATFIVMVGDRIYWAAWQEFVATFGDEVGFEQAYATFDKWKMGATGLGYLIGGGLFGFGHGPYAARLIVTINIASCIVSAVLISRVKLPDGGRTRSSQEITRAARVRHWRTLLRNRPFLTLSMSNCAISFAWLLPSVIMPVYLVKTLELPRWLPALILATNTILATALQVPVTRLGLRFRRSRVLAASAALLVASIGVASMIGHQSSTIAIFLALASITFFSFGAIASGPAASAMAAACAPLDDRGRHLGFFAMATTVSSIVGPAVVGSLLQEDTTVLWILLAAVIALGGLGFILAGAMRPSIG
jgi:MFS family permease